MTPNEGETTAFDWDDAYQNAAYIPGSDTIIARWQEAAAAFRARRRNTLDLPYGPGQRQALHLFQPKTPPKGLLIFVHGGYWLRFDRSYWSHLAAGPLALGYAVAMPSYTLAPEARLSAIAGDVAWAISAAMARVAGPVHLVGHSAGGHLVARMVAEGAPLDATSSSRITSVLSISGVHDLSPLRKTKMNETLQITEDEAISESPAVRKKRLDVPVTVWVGADERPEFLRQTRLLRDAWGAREVIAPAQHHFDVIDGLAEPDSLLTRAALRLD